MMKIEKSIKEEGSVKSKTSLLDLGRLVTDLQYQSLKLRLVPIDTIFRRFERVVRDTSNQLGKKVQLQMEGAKIELDRTILDAITDPLLHILRNCVDHGIETTSERKSLGKPESGYIRLTAYHVGEQIAIKIEDDGNGLVVDSFERKQEIVIKKFSNTSDSKNSFTNATILPDGKVALILDPGMII